MSLPIVQIYQSNIYDRYLNLKNSNKTEYDNYDLAKIFEYFTCIKLTEESKTNFYEYSDIDPEFKEINKMSKSDTGIDCSNLTDTIVQCKLRTNNLTWKECSTFFASQNMFDKILNQTVIKWKKLIIARNEECSLSNNLLDKNELFIDKTYNKQELLNFCENLCQNPPIKLANKQIENKKFELRDYQIECVDLIKNSKKNVVISLPTGTGKNTIIIHSFEDDRKYLILVPRIILMEQLKEEIIKLKPKLKNQIQFIGDLNNVFNIDKNITICVFNSVNIITDHFHLFAKIYIDEAHHIYKPEIYYNDDDNNIDDDCLVGSNDVDSNIDDNCSVDSNDYSSDVNDSNNFNESINFDEDLKDAKKYMSTITNLTKYNNNVYLSATIDKIDDFDYYSKDIREMINLKHLCDYTIQIPIFSDDPTNTNICKHLIQNYQNIIIYCNTQKEGIAINNLLNNLQNNISEYIDCNTPKTKRNKIINKYKEGKLLFLVNVRILVEGFDAPITKGVCFLHLPSNKTTIIQIIGRCLRLHSNKTIANVILPFSSIEDEHSICNFLKVIAMNDRRIKKSYDNKKLNGYITIDTINDDNEIENNDIEFRYNQIYNSIGVLTNGEEIWKNKLERVKLYIDENNKRPSQCNKNKEIKNLGSWISHQIENYNKKEYIMKNEIIYDTWDRFIKNDKYKKYFLSNEQEWFDNLDSVKKYIDTYNEKPLQNENEETKILGSWISNQLTNYKNNKCIMKNKSIYDAWDEFIKDEQYKKYFLSNEGQWFYSLELVITYIDINNKRPSSTDKNNETKILGTWISTQIKNYGKKEYIMKNEIIYDTWDKFIKNEQYKKYFLSNEEQWFINFNSVKKHIDTYNERPSSTNEDFVTKILGTWMLAQISNYRKKTEIMKTEIIYNTWDGFIKNEQYKKYFLSNEEQWFINFDSVKKHIDIHNEKPSLHSENKEFKFLGKWISHQITKYNKKTQIMKTKIIYDMWTEFIHGEQYCKYFTK